MTAWVGYIIAAVVAFVVGLFVTKKRPKAAPDVQAAIVEAVEEQSASRIASAEAAHAAETNINDASAEEVDGAELAELAELVIETFHADAKK